MVAIPEFGAGRGVDPDLLLDIDAAPDEAARAGLREQALRWLKADLAAWSKVLESGPPQVRPVAAQHLTQWQGEAELAGIRDEKELAKLPEAERVAFRQLWSDVEALRSKVAGGK